MSLSRSHGIAGLVVLLTLASTAAAQKAGTHIGYVYPAGGKQGTTFEAVIAGQFISVVDHVYVSGDGVEVSIGEIIKPITGKELNALRIKVDELFARKAVVQNDLKALENFRSFKNAKNLKHQEKVDETNHDKEIEELKRKYANATWTAEDETLLRETRKKIRSAVRRPANPSISELAVVQITVAPNAALGQRELRIATPIALSNPLVFCVGQLPEYSKPAKKSIDQQRSSIMKTGFAPKGLKPKPEMEVALPAVINGQILPGAVDRFRFNAKRGQRLVVAASARELIPYLPDGVPGWFQATLAVYDANGRELAYDDDYRFHPDPVLFCRIPANGQYTVEIKDAIYRGREDFVYRITIGELPFVTSIFPLGGPAGQQTVVKLAGWNLPLNALTVGDGDRGPGLYPIFVRKGRWTSNRVPFAVDTLPECLEQEPNNSPADAQRVTLPIVVNGRIDRPNDNDVLAFEGRAGQQIVAEVLARRLESPLDSVLRLSDASGRQLATNDDYEDKGCGLTTHHADSYLRMTLPADGTYYLRLDDMQHTGGPEYAYRLRVGPPRPDFELRVTPASVTPRGIGSVPLTVYALRKDGFSGDIALSLKDPPAGYALSGGWAPGGQDTVRVTLTVPTAAQPDAVDLRLEGRATIDKQPVVRPVVPAEDMMQAFAYRHLVPAQELKVFSGKRYSYPFDVNVTPADPLKIPAGGTVRLHVVHGRGAKSFPVKLFFELDEPPEGIHLLETRPEPEGVDLVLVSDDAKVKPGMKGNLIVNIVTNQSNPSKKKKAKLTLPSKSAGTLPAVPFEIVPN